MNKLLSKGDREMSSTSNANNQDSNDILSPFIEGIVLAQSIALSLIDAYSEFVTSTPKVIDQLYNIFLNPQNNTTEKQVRDKVEVE